jgi:hypothetical protein
MSKESFLLMSADELVKSYVENGVEQHRALEEFDTRKFSRLFRTMRAIEDELKSREGDQRSVLLPLYGHRNLQVRINAAKATWSIAPELARRQLQAIRALKWNPQSMDAGMALWAWDEGIWQPD